MPQGFPLARGRNEMPNTALLVATICLCSMLAIFRHKKGDILPNVFDLAGNILVVIFVTYILRL
jgi:hypothetical protein